MARRGKTDRVPKTRAGGTWTEAAFWGFIRSGLRQLSRRWPPRSQVIRERRVPYKGPNKRRKFEIQCEWCHRPFALNHVEVDHIEECGSLKSFADLAVFAERLFCEPGELRVLCKGCHRSKASPRKKLR